MIQLGEKPIDIEAFVDHAASVGMPLEVIRITEPPAKEIYASDLVLVRPDLMIAWRKRAEEYDPALILTLLEGREVRDVPRAEFGNIYESNTTQTCVTTSWHKLARGVAEKPCH